jgi:hypothetical protein
VKLTVIRVVGVVLIAGGLFFVGWGLQHFNDPMVTIDDKGYLYPAKQQFRSMALGALMIFMGTGYAWKDRFPWS